MFHTFILLCSSAVIPAGAAAIILYAGISRPHPPPAIRGHPEMARGLKRAARGCRPWRRLPAPRPPPQTRPPPGTMVDADAFMNHYRMHETTLMPLSHLRVAANIQWTLWRTPYPITSLHFWTKLISAALILCACVLIQLRQVNSHLRTHARYCFFPA
jgi:hypothetical protein